MDNLLPVSPHSSMLCHPEHIVQFYLDDNFLLDWWESLISNAVETGNAVICVATKTHSERLAERLKLHGPKVTVAGEQGRYIKLDAAEAVSAVTVEGKFNGARFFDLVEPVIAKARAAIDRDTSRVFVLGEAVALLWSKGEYDGVISWEHLWNGLAQANSLSLRCFYPMQALNFRREQSNCQMLCAEHSTTILPRGLPMLSGEKGTIHLDAEMKQALAEAEQLIQSEVRLRYPEWQGKYRAALLETDRDALFKKVEVAQAAVLTRLHELRPETDKLGEWHQLMHARSGLQIIKKEKVGFFEA